MREMGHFERDSELQVVFSLSTSSPMHCYEGKDRIYCTGRAHGAPSPVNHLDHEGTYVEFRTTDPGASFL